MDTDEETIRLELVIEKLTELTTGMEEVAEHLARVDALLTKYQPVIEAYLDPVASGPVAWAVRRKMK